MAKEIMTDKLAETLEAMMNEAKNIVGNSMAARQKINEKIPAGARKRYSNYEMKRLQNLKKQVDEFSGGEQEFRKIFKKVKSYKPRSLSLKKNLAGIGVGTVMGKIFKSNQPETKGF